MPRSAWAAWAAASAIAMSWLASRSSSASAVRGTPGASPCTRRSASATAPSASDLSGDRGAQLLGLLAQPADPQLGVEGQADGESDRSGLLDERGVASAS